MNYVKIKNKEMGVSGGSYNIPDDKLDRFFEIYKKHVFEHKKHAYLTEYQHEIGQMAIDFDFRYGVNVEKKQHTSNDITSFISLCMESFDEIFQNVDNKEISFYIFEKAHVNMLEDKTKDGIHIIINIDCDATTKLMFRKYILRDLPHLWDKLPLTNDWESVFDEGVLKGKTNWQLYGSRKPGNEPYEIKYIFKVVKHEDKIDVKEVNVSKINMNEYFPKFMIRNKDGLVDSLRIRESKMDEYSEMKNKNTNKRKLNTVIRRAVVSFDSYQNINDPDTLDEYIEAFKADEEVSHHLKEIHDYAMCLPEEFYGPGSYDKWMRVGWALKNTSAKLYITWLKMSSQSEEFDWATHDLYEHWESFDFYQSDGVTDKSIVYWAKTTNKEKYMEIYNSSSHHYIYTSLMTTTDYDIANALYHLYGCNFACASVNNDSWYEFKQNRWKPIEAGSTLRQLISKDMYKEYQSVFQSIQMKHNEQQNSITADNGNDDKKYNIKNILQTIYTLKQTSRKNNIMREAKEIFYDPEFFGKLDKNNYLLGCNNCVIDFKAKSHRKGQYDDYISKTTNLNYLPLSHYEKRCPNIIEDIKKFMDELFPEKELCEYMWEHLASTLLGTTQNQTFNIYTGSGANGKSILIQLMSLVLGEYKGTVPISLITQKRNQIGGASPEVYKLIGVRYAVMQEPSKGDKINEGILKELTGGDPIQCRALFKDSVTFIPQFKLAVATNTLLDVNSDDDGTWRRMCVVEFKSKFTHKPYQDPKYPKEHYPNQFKMDDKLGDKFELWAPVMLSMLVDIGYKTQGRVTIVNAVKNKSEEYRSEQNIMFEFYNENIDPNPPDDGRKYHLKISDVLERIQDWFSKINGNRRDMPNRNEIKKFFDLKHGKEKNNGWVGICLKPFESSDGDDEMN
jgi:P4 family phage/plasmid primase-like protien